MSTDPSCSNPDATRKPIGVRPGGPPRFAITSVTALAVLAIGAGIGAFAMKHEQGWRTAAYTPMAITAIPAMTDWSTVEIKGQVAEIFGNKFVIQDTGGRGLVETGRQGEGAPLVAKDETVSVQGRFEHGFLHAAYIVHADGKVLGLDFPPGPPRHGPHGPMGWLKGPHADVGFPAPQTGAAG